MPGPENRTALVCGVSGQDGAYLAQHLVARGYRVVGTSRDVIRARSGNLARLGIADQVELLPLDLGDRKAVAEALRVHRPREIYDLAGQSSVGRSFEQPAETIDSIAFATLNLLEAVRVVSPTSRLFNAASSECFGDTGGRPADESAAFQPRSPYAVAKSAAFWAVANYRQAYGLFACSGLLFNHESPLRPAGFVTRKIVQAAVRIAGGSAEQLVLGNIDIQRDWGWAPEYVDAMHRMLQLDEARDIVIATGETQPLSAFAEAAFSALGLRAEDHMRSDPALMRPTDIAINRADPALALARLGWRAEVGMAEVARRMVTAELATREAAA